MANFESQGHIKSTDGQTVFDSQGRRLIYDRGPEYMAQRHEEERIAAGKQAKEVATQGAYENSPEKMANDKIAADMKKLNKQRAAIQTQQANHGVVDQYGTFYAPAGGGNVIRTTDGTFMQKTAGGYINTKTGAFCPAH